MYGLPGLPLAMLGLPLYMYLPSHYATHLGLATVGAVLLVARLWDVITDPVVGWLSDRIRWRHGRRKLLMLAGLPVLLFSCHQLFNPPATPTPGYLLLWSLVLYLAWTLVVLPYHAWGAELSEDYHERSSITGIREGFVIGGTLLAGLLPVLVATDTTAETLEVYAGVLILLLPAALLLALVGVAEPARRDSPVPWKAGLVLLRENRPFLRLLSAYLVNGIANALPATLFIIFVSQYLAAPEWTGRLLAVYFIAGILGLPLWLMLAKRIGKHRAWCYSMLFACMSFIWVPFLDSGDVTAFLLICLFSGLSLGVDMALPASMQADVVDIDSAKGGGQRTGLFFGLWGMATKLALALAVGIAFPLLEFASYSTTATSNTPEAEMALLLLYGLAPILFKLIAISLVWNFPLDQTAQHALRRSLHHETTFPDNRTADFTYTPRGMHKHEG
ncbi:MAG: MFS transporter [Pseudomonadota bacterium]